LASRVPQNFRRALKTLTGSWGVSLVVIDHAGRVERIARTDIAHWIAAL
jgi:hypothetical protein